MIISLEGVRVFIGGEEVLRGADLVIREGELVVVRGRSGVGKTTLARVAALLITPSSGRVSFLGEDVSAAPDRVRSALRLRFIGYVDQHYSLIPSLTILENVALPLRLAGAGKAEALERASETLEALGIGGLANRYPREVSGGQRQRAAIARALVKRPKLVVADEPLSNLDDDTATQVMHLLASYVAKEGAGVLVTTTDLLMDYAGSTREYVLSNGVLKLREHT